MAKYYFREKLEEGVLYTKSGILTAVISGTEYKAVFPPGRSPKHVEKESIPCLARKCSNWQQSCLISTAWKKSLIKKKTLNKEENSPSRLRNARTRINTGFFFLQNKTTPHWSVV